MALEIPPSLLEATRLLQSLSDDELDRLFDALRTSDPEYTPGALAGKVVQKTRIPIEKLAPIVHLLGSLFLSMERARVPADELAHGLAESVGKEGDEAQAQDRIERLERWIKRFLTLEEPLGISAKANGVLVQCENPLVSARIMTDIRPIFRSDIHPAAALIVHNLELIASSPSKTSGRNAFFFALDSEDLKLLKAVVDRAIQKEAKLEAVVEQSGLKLIMVAPEG